VSTEVEAPPKKFTALSRMFHWLTAILIFAALGIGFTMVNWLAGYATLRVIHMSIGALILLVVVLRLVNRARHHPPAWPATVGRREGRFVIWSERTMYALLLAQPLVGWAMVSASGTPVRVFGGLRLPPIAPVNINVFSAFREAHSILAYLLVAVVLAHVSAVLAHSIVLSDGMLRRMTFHLGRRQD
jgi:cytochrome b561